MKQLAVSRKFRKNIIVKINSSFTDHIAERLITLADSLMTEGVVPDFSKEDQMVQSIFRYISSDIMTAIDRSRRARQRVAQRKQQKANDVTTENSPKRIYVPYLEMTLVEGVDFVKNGSKFTISPNVGVTRQQRRQAERELEHAERSRIK
ncbi:MAG: hypothetical protein NC098_04985 [Lachnoclostridium sp.]|nr:hypothetical protein [Lachnoclostridium sp.]